MDATAFAAAARVKAELDRTEEFARALRTASLYPHDARPGSEDVFAIAREAEEFLRVTSDASHADRLKGDVATAIDTALALNSYRLRIRLLRVGVHV